VRENKKSFIHSGTKEFLRGTTRITVEGWNSTVTWVHDNGWSRRWLLGFTSEVLFREYRRVRSMRRSLLRHEGLPPRSPFSLTGWPTTPAVTFMMGLVSHMPAAQCRQTCLYIFVIIAQELPDKPVTLAGEPTRICPKPHPSLKLRGKYCTLELPFQEC